MEFIDDIELDIPSSSPSRPTRAQMTRAVRVRPSHDDDDDDDAVDEMSMVRSGE
jgi:hypothetical protein